MKIKNLLIANRGEIAVRVISTAKRMGVKTFVIKTSKEPDALYLRLADDVIDFSQTVEDLPEFLDIERIIQAAKQHKIDAVHPGYGFLAENPYFAQRCEEEGIIFIGPSPSAIYKMGNKTIAKQLASKHNIPLLQGSQSDVKNTKEAIEIASHIGYPVILKAAAGGGGRGMRIVEKSSNMEKMFKMATTEADKAFNNPAVFIEKYVRNPRHIEFQIVGDRHGNYIHLGERECSIQRKHQKLIEESPSVAINDKLRKEMGEAAIRIAKSVDYYSAGTVEFLLDADRNYFFMEMNTRIQVEHPVTEMVSGTDLIELQILIAEGKELPIKQKDVKLNGWAIECRVNAEDPQANFSPNLGIVEKISFPKGKSIRIDSGVTDYSVITPYYDSMIAKLIVHAESREKAIFAATLALKKFWIKGIKTTIPFCLAVMNNRKFIKGDFNTSFIEKDMKQLYYNTPDDELLASYVATFDFAADLETDKTTKPNFERGRNISPWVLNKRLKSL